MRLRTFVGMLIAIFFSVNLFANGIKRECEQTLTNSIIILAELPDEQRRDSIKLEFSDVNQIGYRIDRTLVKEKVSNGYVKWRLFSANPISVILFSKSYIVEPGDSICVRWKGGTLSYSGKGAEKFCLKQEFQASVKGLIEPSNPVHYSTNSFHDYVEWNKYLNQQLNLIDSLLQIYRPNISTFAYDYLQKNFIATVEENRISKFMALSANAFKLGLTSESLSDIYDSTLNNNKAKWLRSISSPVDHIYYYINFIRVLHQRNCSFDFLDKNLTDESKRKVFYYELGRRMFRGHVKENYLAYLLVESGFKEIGFTPEVESILKDYYRRSGYSMYREYVRKWEVISRERAVRKGAICPDFVFFDSSGHVYKKENLIGKIVFMNFFNRNSLDRSISYSINRIKNAFENDSSVIFINVITDKRNSNGHTSQQKGSVEGIGAINLYVEQKEEEQAILKGLNLNKIPAFCCLDQYGKFLIPPTSIYDDEERHIREIRKQLVISHDGPYIKVRNNTGVAHFLYGNNIDTIVFPSNIKSVKFSAQTDLFNRQFDFSLNKTCLPEPCEFEQPTKLVALSDIEGNFDAFRKLLQVTGVIDSNYNWTFGNGHLVLVGDVFDRGPQVTECLWLIYALEGKAKFYGGYVHYILGNHEIMNLMGDSRYIHQKYRENSRKMMVEYHQLFDSVSVLGKWLRTKNIVEKIGDVLFVHAGISKEVNSLNLTILQLNSLARPYYDRPMPDKQSINSAISILYDSKASPFWYRLYYQEEGIRTSTKGVVTYKASQAQVDSTLSKFKVNAIVTGHTIVSDTISLHYDGAVINTDTRHRYGKSEALLIEGGSYFRINIDGERKSLNIFDKRREFIFSNNVNK